MATYDVIVVYDNGTREIWRSSIGMAAAVMAALRDFSCSEIADVELIVSQKEPLRDPAK